MINFEAVRKGEIEKREMCLKWSQFHVIKLEHWVTIEMTRV